MSDDIWEAEILEAEVYEEWIEEPLESIERREKRQLDIALASTRTRAACGAARPALRGVGLAL